MPRSLKRGSLLQRDIQKRNQPLIRAIPGVIYADALIGTPDIAAIVRGDDIADMDAVIDNIAEINDIISSETRVACWLEGVGPPRTAN